MGCMVEMLDDGQQVDVHLFDTQLAATHYLTVSRRYTYDRRDTLGTLGGATSVDLYNGPNPGEHASLREKNPSSFSACFWKVCFWTKDTHDRKTR
jgi:hypothetical protein